MTTEEFDDAIRKKFQARRSTVTREEVDSVLKYVRGKRNRLTYLRWIRNIAILLGIAVFAGLIYNKVKAEVTIGDEVKAEVAKVKVEDTVGNVNSGKDSVGNQNSKSMVFNNLKPSSNRMNDPSTAKKQDVKKQDENIQDENTIPEPVMQKDTSTFAARNRTDIQKIEDPAIHIPGAKASTVVTKLIKQEENGIVIRKKTFANLNLGFATGVGFDLGMNFISYSLVEDISFLKHFSFSTGIKYSVHAHQKFKDENEFYREKQEKFTRTYDPEKYNYVTSGISNIDIQTKSYQVPLTLNYKIGMKHNFNLLLSTGSNITINATQQVNFENIKSSPGNPELQYNSFVHKIYGPVFREINLGIGLQYVWKKFSMDASPNLGVHLQKLNNDPAVYGLLKVRVNAFF